MPNLTPQDVDVRLTETRNEFSEEHTRLWEGLEDEKVSRIAGDEANKQFTEQVQGENAGTESRLSTEVIHRAAGDLNNITSLNALAVALSDYRIKTDLEIANEKIARQQLGVNLNTRVDNFVASWDHDKFLIYTAIQAVQTDVDGKYASMDLRIKKYEDMLQDITMDSIQITMDNGEINMGAWTILSQAREWDLEILSNVKGYQNQTTEDLNQALEDLQNKLPVTQDIINQALEQLGNSPIIKDLEAEIGGLEGTIDGVTQTMMDHRVETQNQLVNMSKELGDQVKAETEARAKAIQEEAAARLEAVQREAAIRQQQLTQESADRTAEIDEKIKDFEGGLATDLTAVNKRIDDANTKVDNIKAGTDTEIVTLTNKSNQLVTDLKVEETARIADVKKLNDGLTAEIEFRKDGDTANLTALNNYKTSNNQALANVREELRVNVTATTANAQKISALDTRLTANESLAASAVFKAETALTETSALATQMDSVNASIDGLETELAKKADATAVNQLIADVKVIDGKVTTNSADITTLKTNVTTLDGKVTGNTTATSELKTTQTQQGDKITQLTADTTLLKNEMTAVKDDLATKVDSTAFNELSTKVTKNDGDITAQGQSITRIDNSLTITNDKLEKKAEASALTALDSKVTSIDGKVVSQGSAITKLSNDLATTNTEVSKKANASALTALDNKVTSIDGKVTSQGTQITELKNSLEAIDLELDGKADSAALQTLDSKVTQQGKDITAQGTAITNLTGRVTTAEGGINKKADTTALNALSTKVETIDGKVVANSNSITSLNSLVTTNTDNIAKKADASALQALDTKVTQQGNNITSQGSAITKLTNDLAVTNTEVSKKATTAALQTLDTKVTQQGKDITSVSTAQTALGNRVTTVEGTLTTKANSSAVQQLDSRVTAAEGKITSQGTSITNLQNSLTTLDGKVNTKVDSTAFNALSTKVNVQGTSIDSHSQQLTTLSNSIAGKADSSVVSTLDSKVNKIDKNVTANTSAITALKSGLDGKADVTALNSLTTEVSLINGVTTTNASNISALNSTVSAMDGRVTSQSAAIDVLTVKQKQFGDTLNQVVQDTTVLTNKVTGLDNEVKANTQAITDTKAEVTKNGTDIKALTEKTTTVEAKIDNIKSGGDNLLKKSNVPAVWNPADPKYPHGKWDMSEPWEVGATYTLTVCVTHKSTVGETHVAFYAGGGRQYVAGITNAGDRFIRTIQFVKTAVDANNPTIQAYLLGWETNINAIGTIHWVVMTKGASVGVTNWKPSNQDTVDALANTASAEALQNLRAEVNVIDDKVIAATNDLTILKSTVDTNQANLVNNYYTKTQANEATAGQITSFSAGLNIGGENLIYGTKKFDTTGNLKPNTHGFGTYWPHDLLFGTHTMYTATTAWTGFCFTGFKDNVADVDMVLSFWASSVGGQDIPVYNIASGSDTLLFTVKGFEWKQYSAKIPKGTRITNGSRGIAEFSIPAGGTLAYGAIQLQKGTKATAWTPTYNDFDNPIKANASAVQSVSAQVTEIDGKVSASASQILTLESFKNNINNGRIPGHKELVIDLRTGYNQDTYFPVAVSPISVTNRTRLRVYSTLDGKAKPAWSTHGSGFSLTLDWETTGNGWGIINAEQVINNSEWLYTLNGICPALGPTQMGNSSEPVVYLRGGGYYVISLPEPNTIRICPPSGSTAGINGQTVSPIAYNGGMVPMSVSKDATTTKVRLQQTNEVIDGVKAVSTVSVDNNGFLSGYGLISQLVNGVVQSAFGVNADYFYVGTSNNNKKKPFMVLTSPQNIGGVTYPAGTWMDVALIANATIGTAHIQDASITNAKIKDLNANKITAGIINADRIGANTITAEKLVIGDTTNLWGNQYFESNVRPMNARSAWFGYTPQLKGRGVQMWGRDHMAPYSTRIPIKAGDEFVIEFTAGLNTGAFKALGVGLWVYDATGSQGTYAFQFGVPEQIATLGNGWYRYRRVFTVADNGSGLPAAYGTLYFQIPQSDTEANPTYWTAGDVVVRKRVGGELIVNGAITADKLYSNTVSAMFANFGSFTTTGAGGSTTMSGASTIVKDTSGTERIFIGIR